MSTNNRASPAPSLPEDVERVVERPIWTCDENDRSACRNPHGCHCKEIAAISTRKAGLEQQLAEVRAEAAKWREAFSGMHRQTMTAEAERDRLAAENERLREICRMLRDSYEPRTGTYALGELHQARESARAALASLEERT